MTTRQKIEWVLDYVAILIFGSLFVTIGVGVTFVLLWAAKTVPWQLIAFAVLLLSSVWAATWLDERGKK